MKQGAIFSLVLHLAILAMVLIGLPTSSNPFEVGNPVAVPIVFENAVIAETTNQVEGAEPVAEAKVEPPSPPQKPEPKLEQQAALEPPPEPEPAPVQPPPEPEAVVTPPPPAPEPAPPTPEPPAVAEPAPPEPTPPEPQVAEPEPEPPPPEPVPEQVAVAAPQPEPTPEPVPVPSPEAKVEEAAKEPDAAAPPEKPRKKVTLPEPPPKKEVAKKENPLDSILKDVTKREETPQQAKPQEQQEAASTKPQTATAATKSGGTISQSIKDAIAGQVGRCWSVDAGAMEQVAVEIRAIMNPDGTVRSAEIVDAGRYNSDPRLRRHAEAALRAVKNPSCQPFTMLPANAYDEWSTIVFNLDPKSMF